MFSADPFEGFKLKIFGIESFVCPGIIDRRVGVGKDTMGLMFIPTMLVARIYPTVREAHLSPNTLLLDLSIAAMGKTHGLSGTDTYNSAKIHERLH